MAQIIETKRLILREWEPTDLEELYKILSDPETMSFWPEPFTREGAQSWIDNSKQSFKQYGFGRMAMVLKESNVIIGDCGFKRATIDGKEENDLGFIVYKDFWKQGFGREAALATFKYGIQKLGLSRIVANMEDSHIASRTVAEQIGLKLEKTFLNQRNRNKKTLLLSWNGGEE